MIRQYVPAPQEFVVGVVVGRSGENWRVDIGSAQTATLDGLAFEGATKRNRPNLKVSCDLFVVIWNLQHSCMILSGWLLAVRSSVFGTQGHGARARVFRRPNAEG